MGDALARLIPDADWQWGRHGAPADDGYRLYLAELTNKLTWRGSRMTESREWTLEAHAAVNDRGHVVHFLGCDRDP